MKNFMTDTVRTRTKNNASMTWFSLTVTNIHSTGTRAFYECSHKAFFTSVSCDISKKEEFFCLTYSVFRIL